ncbi:MAG: hypothetical protein PHH59_14395 [Methylovulum sp.]|uniref:hypothetical protein n=1 Tax=Methylovulum sp. TaxID=1916980 RepID=UPI002630A2A4|nr:hypothetical protein [Methylovulum sp.]MDD2725195.1 hypothetical protein [Methylovulum sp.]MDD5125446.1 hypothetical protein [Methylovulum sp.]
MTGWKTWLTAVAAIFYGFIGMAMDWHTPDVGVQFVLYGLGLVGIGHKIEKIGR